MLGTAENKKVMIMYAPVVGYYTGEREEGRERWAEEQVVANGYGRVLLWRRDGAKLQSAPAEQRRRLHEALFCIRARYAFGLWIPDWTVLGDVTTRELICAEVWAAGGDVIVGDRTIDRDGAIPAEQRPLRELARVGARLRNEAFPRENDPDDPDIGLWDGDWETARLAHKLYQGFGDLTYAEVADFLNATDYATKTRKLFTAGNVKHLIDRNSADLRSSRSSDVQAPASGGGKRFCLFCYGPDAEITLPAAETYNDNLEEPYERVRAISEHRDVTGDQAEGSGLDPTMRRLPALLAVAASTPAAGMGAVGVFVSSAESFGSPIVRELVYGQLWQAGADVIVNSIPVDPENCADAVTAVLRPAARSGARLHAALRAHDSGTIIGEATAVELARKLAQELRRQAPPLTLEQIAQRLEDEAIPTRKRAGRWGASAVRELLDEAWETSD